MKESFLILDVNGHFWSGLNWVPEYPDAVLYDSLTTARGVASKLTRAERIVTRYGLASEMHFSPRAGQSPPPRRWR